VIISSNLKSSSQCQKAANKAMSILGMVKKHFKRLDKDSFKNIYKGYIRPHFEYCIQAWSPSLVKDKLLLENVQRRATKQVYGLHNQSYEDRLRILGLTTLETWRLRGDLIETYKILYGREDIDSGQLFKFRVNDHDLRGHDFKVYKQHNRKHFFSQRVTTHGINCDNYRVSGALEKLEHETNLQDRAADR